MLDVSMLNVSLLNLPSLNLPVLNAFSAPILLFIAVLLCKKIINHFYSVSRINFFHLYCQNLALKVNKPNNSQQQQKIAGLMATVITFTPLIMIVWLFGFFIEVTWLWQGFILYFSLGKVNLAQTNKILAQALVAKQTYLAKQTLNPLVLRNTEQLSEIGLSKACIEMQLLKTLQQGFVVTCYFLLLGPLAALGYRILLEMHYSWNIKHKQFNHFGLPVHYLTKYLEWLPVRIFTLMMLLSITGQSLSLCWRLIRGKFFQLNNNIAIHCLSLSLSIKLGGVAMYGKEKLRRESFNEHARQPQPTDIIHANKRIKQPIYLGLTALVLTAIFALVIQINS